MVDQCKSIAFELERPEVLPTVVSAALVVPLNGLPFCCDVECDIRGVGLGRRNEVDSHRHALLAARRTIGAVVGVLYRITIYEISSRFLGQRLIRNRDQEYSVGTRSRLQTDYG